MLYEMLAGRRAFEGETVSETLADVMKSEPPWTALPPNTLATLRNVVRRCLEKDPRLRVRDIGDVRLALAGAFETAAAMEISDFGWNSTTTVTASSRRKSGRSNASTTTARTNPAATGFRTGLVWYLLAQVAL